MPGRLDQDGSGLRWREMGRWGNPSMDNRRRWLAMGSVSGLASEHNGQGGGSTDGDGKTWESGHVAPTSQPGPGLRFALSILVKVNRDGKADGR